MSQNPAPDLRALVVSYSFPPVGGAGVQRVLKLVKYLPQHRVAPTVLTVKNPSVPLRDETLMAELPETVEVLRARTLEPGYGVKQAAWTSMARAGASAGTSARPGLKQRGTQRLTQVARRFLVPDPQVLWQPAAQRALLSRLHGARDDVLFITGPPFSQFLLAPLARLWPGTAPKTAIVLDYRDEWSTYRQSYEMGVGVAGNAAMETLEGALLRCAHAVTTATPEFRDHLLARFPFLRPERVHAIPNGYDPDDFPPALPEPPADRLVVTYAGTVFRLTSARGLLGALRRLQRDEPELSRSLEVRFLGRIVKTEEDAFAGSEALGVRRLGYVDHRRVLQELSGSHLVLCLLDEVPGAERIYPGKIFELMYLGRPCLTLAPEGALTRLVRRHDLGPVLPPRDEAAIAALLADRLRAFRKGRIEVRSRAVDIDRYHRCALTGEFAAVMREASARARRS